MADEKVESKPQEPAPDKPASDKPAEKGKGRSIVPWIIIAVIVLAAAGAGVGLGRLFAGNGKPKAAEEASSKEAAAEAEPAAKQGAKAEPAAKQGAKAEPAAKHGDAKHGDAKQAEQLKPDKPGAAKEDSWYYNLEPVVANLDEPGATRYVRAALTLEMSPEISAEKGAAFMEQKKPLLTNLLTIYLAGLNIEATRGDKNLKRIQSDICDTFNERLFPNGKPLIKRILIKEFAVQ
jgi:flagellar basal body-associated protein FliL